MSDTRTLGILDWPRIADALAQRARTPYGRDAAAAAAPLEPAAAEAMRERVGLWRTCIAAENPPPLSDIPDIREWLSRLSREGTLEGAQLLAIADNMQVLSTLGRFLGSPELPPPLRRFGDSLADFSAIHASIGRVIAADGGIRENASETLLSAVSEERARTAELRTKAEALLDDARIQPLLRDRYVTQREGRFVLPIRIERGSAVRGIVHDASGSGATVYVEPEELHAANNRLVEVRALIREEIARLLAELTERVVRVLPDLSAALEILGTLDAEVARARLAIEWGAVNPRNASHVSLRGARQPLLLLRGLDVVPIDIEHPGAGFGVILSGPNAGGKTAALKTLGLALILARAGCHVPADAAAFPFHWDVAAELGDPQNLGEDLSTFSGHLSRLVEISRHAGADVLLLVDELLKGTDPADGAPLARAWLEEMAGKGCPLWVTTHYGSIKALPFVDSRFTAARTAYALGTPQYSISYGEAGSSYAFETAERLAFPPALLARARRYREGEITRAEKALAEVDELRHALDQATRQADADRLAQRKLRDRLQAELDLLNTQRTELVRRAAEPALRDLDRAQAAAQAAEEDLRQKRQEARRTRIIVGDTRKKVERTVSETEIPGKVEPGDLVPGATVYSRRFRRNGVVVRPPTKKHVTLQIGKLQAAVELADLAPAQAEAVQPVERRRAVRAPEVPDQLDVRGERFDAARHKLDEWIDGAMRARQTGDLKILHGIGTGALRDGIRAHLREHPAGLDFHPAPDDQGGDAVTVIELA